MSEILNLMLPVNSTFVAAYHSEESCRLGARAIYEQKGDPYRVLEPEVLAQIVDLQMAYVFQRDDKCIRGGANSAIQ